MDDYIIFIRILAFILIYILALASEDNDKEE